MVLSINKSFGTLQSSCVLFRWFVRQTMNSVLFGYDVFFMFSVVLLTKILNHWMKRMVFLICFNWYFYNNILEISTSYAKTLMFYYLRWKVIVRFVDIGKIVDLFKRSFHNIKLNVFDISYFEFDQPCNRLLTNHSKYISHLDDIL